MRKEYRGIISVKLWTSHFYWLRSHPPDSARPQCWKTPLLQAAFPMGQNTLNPQKAAHLYLNLGFQYEGVLRKNCRKNGVLYDVHLMSMLAEEYFERYGKWMQWISWKNANTPKKIMRFPVTSWRRLLCYSVGGVQEFHLFSFKPFRVLASSFQFLPQQARCCVHFWAISLLRWRRVWGWMPFLRIPYAEFTDIHGSRRWHLPSFPES